jgi:eukaryotic-like serine/threonine-protein kinase
VKSCPTCKSNYSDHYSHCPLDGAALVEASLWAEGTVVRGKYRILARIGQGGMGAVYKAEHLRFKELCALKVMAPELAKDPIFLKRFEHEAVLTRKLQHPNAVRVEDLDEAEDGRPFIVMEYIEGRSLKEVIASEAPLPVLLACSIAKQVASALDAAHRLGMVHRDIKPDNIVLLNPGLSLDHSPLPGGEGGRRPGDGPNHPIAQSPDHPIAKVLDFGIAKIKEGMLETTGIGMTLTGTGMAIGTPQYMSPEQALGKKGDELDGRSDLYSLGVVMYQMLTGELPLQADTPIQMLMAHIQTVPPDIRTRRPDVPGTVAEIVMQCLEKSPDRRPLTAQAIAEAIVNWLGVAGRDASHRASQPYGPEPEPLLQLRAQDPPEPAHRGAAHASLVPAWLRVLFLLAVLGIISPFLLALAEHGSVWSAGPGPPAALVFWTSVALNCFLFVLYFIRKGFLFERHVASAAELIGKRSYAQAESELRAALYFREEDVEIRTRLTSLLLSQARYEEGIAEYWTMVRRHPKNHSARHTLGLLLEKTGDNYGALEQYRIAHELAPKDAAYAAAYQRLSTALAR